jgi:hypothetical protein
MLLSPAVNLSPTSLIPAVKANNMTDNGGKLTADDNDAGCKFTAGYNDIGGKKCQQ